LYVYTNSSYRWTNNALVENIENASKVKFNKPYFTRENSESGTLNKLLSNIYDIIMDNLSKKYPLLSKDENKKFVFEKQLVFIDDIENNLNDFSKKQILCPYYDYCCYYDIKQKIMKKYNVPEKDFDDTEILKYFEDYDLHIFSPTGSIYQQDSLYQDILEISYKREIEIYNKSYINDTFFEDLMKIIKLIKIFDEKNIEKINKELLKINKV